MTKKILIIGLMFALLSVYGCCKQSCQEKKSVIVASVGDCVITKDDLANKVPGENKERQLDEMIEKKLLIMAAQKENFDKDRAFMKEIERYWEQALIKLLLKKKVHEFGYDVVITDAEAKKEYDKIIADNRDIGPFENMAAEIKDDLRRAKIQGRFNNWVEELKKETDIRIYKENL